MIDSNKDGSCLGDVVVVDLELVSYCLQDGILKWGSAVCFVFDLDQMIFSTNDA